MYTRVRVCTHVRAISNNLITMYPYLVIGYPHEGIGHSTVETPCVDYEQARQEVDNLLANVAIIHHVFIYKDGKLVSKHY